MASPTRAKLLPLNLERTFSSELSSSKAPAVSFKQKQRGKADMGWGGAESLPSAASFFQGTVTNYTQSLIHWYS